MSDRAGRPRRAVPVGPSRFPRGDFIAVCGELALPHDSEIGRPPHERFGRSNRRNSTAFPEKRRRSANRTSFSSSGLLLIVRAILTSSLFTGCVVTFPSLD